MGAYKGLINIYYSAILYMTVNVVTVWSEATLREALTVMGDNVGCCNRR